MENNLFSKIKEFKNVAPSEEWKLSQKDILMTQIRAQVKDRKKQNAFGAVCMQAVRNVFGMRSFSVLFKQSSFVALSAILALGTGVFGVQAAERSLPGDLLYGVKRTKEKVRVSLSTSEERRTELHIEFAGKRLQEFAVLKEKDLDSDKKVEKMTVAVVDFKEEINEVKDKLSKAEYTIKEPRKIIEVADLIDEKVEAFTEYLDDNIKDDTQDEVTSKNHLGILDTVEDAIKAGREVSTEAVTLIVKQKDKEGIDDTVKEEIKQKVKEKIEKAKEDLVEMADDIKKEIEKEPTPETEEGNNESEAGEEESATIVSTESLPENDTISNEAGNSEKQQEELQTESVVSTEEKQTEIVLSEVAIDEVKKVIEEEPKKAESLLNEADQLADEGDLDQALEKLQATHSLVDETKDKVEDIITKAIEESEAEQEILEQVAAEEKTLEQSEKNDIIDENSEAGSTESQGEVITDESSSENSEESISEETINEENKI